MAAMVASPVAFYRSAAAIMAADFAHTRSTGITVRAGGDCHLLNLGDFVTPERQPAFDINDFIVARRMSWEATNRPLCS
jgi:uncharacterized protein (DUF2252 family)